MGSGADTQLMSGWISAQGIMMNSQVDAANIRQRGQDALFQNEYAAGQEQLAARMTDLKATQTDYAMRRRTADDMANADAIMALSGTDDSLSPTNYAVRNWSQGQSDRQIQQANWNSHMDSEGQRFAANMDMIQGYKEMDVAEYNSIATLASGNMAAMGALLQGIAASDNANTEKASARTQSMIGLASSGLGLIGAFI